MANSPATPKPNWYAPRGLSQAAIGENARIRAASFRTFFQASQSTGSPHSSRSARLAAGLALWSALPWPSTEPVVLPNDFSVIARHRAASPKPLTERREWRRRSGDIGGSQRAWRDDATVPSRLPHVRMPLVAAQRRSLRHAIGDAARGLPCARADPRYRRRSCQPCGDRGGLHCCG
jgi:hypothetical protein